MLTLSYTTVSDCCTFPPKIYVSFPRIPFPETTEIPNEACLTLAKLFPFQSAFAFFVVDDATDSSLSSVCKCNFLPLPLRCSSTPALVRTCAWRAQSPALLPCASSSSSPHPARAGPRGAGFYLPWCTVRSTRHMAKSSWDMDRVRDSLWGDRLGLCMRSSQTNSWGICNSHLKRHFDQKRHVARISKEVARNNLRWPNWSPAKAFFEIRSGSALFSRLFFTPTE